MNKKINRRSFLESSALAFPIIFIPSVLKSKSPKRNKICGGERGITFYYRTHGFNSSEEAKIREALGTFASRFVHRWVLDYTYKKAGNAYCMKGGYWKDCNMHRQNYYSKSQMLRYQIKKLAIAVPFPEMDIYAYHKRDNTWGLSSSSHAIKVMNSNGIDIRGKFKMKLNRFYLGFNAGKAQWAKTIAHEALHNLGHCHGAQMEAFSDAVYHCLECD